MDPNTKLLLDEMKKLSNRFTKMEERVDNLDGAIGERFKAIEDSAQEISKWKSIMDSALDELRLKVCALNKQVERVVLDQGASSVGIFTSPKAAAALTSAGKPAVGPDGHRVEHLPRETAYGSVMAYTHLPANGGSC